MVVLRARPGAPLPSGPLPEVAPDPWPWPCPGVVVVVVVVVAVVAVEEVVVLDPDDGAVVVVVAGFGPCPGLPVVAVVVGALLPAGVPFEAPGTGSELVPGPEVAGPDVAAGAEFGVEPRGSVLDVGRVRNACSASAASEGSLPVDSPAAVILSCAPRSAGAGGLIKARLGNPKVGKGIGPSRGSRAKPSISSPRYAAMPARATRPTRRVTARRRPLSSTKIGCAALTPQQSPGDDD